MTSPRLAGSGCGAMGRGEGGRQQRRNKFRTPLAELSTEKWREINGANLDSVFFMSRAFIPLLLKGTGASILNVASSFGLIGNPLMPVYCATKGAVVNLTRQMAIDYGPQGIRVNAHLPGANAVAAGARLYREGPVESGRAQAAGAARTARRMRRDRRHGRVSRQRRGVVCQRGLRRRGRRADHQLKGAVS